MQDRSAGQQGLTADSGDQLGLPAANIGRADLFDGAVAEPGPDMTPEAVFCRRQRGRAAVGVSGPHLPPVVCPLTEHESPTPSFSPGAAAHLQAFLGGEVAGLVGGVDGLAALGAVMESPGDQVPVPSGPQRSPAAPRWRRSQVAGPILGKQARVQNPDKDEVSGSSLVGPPTVTIGQTLGLRTSPCSSLSARSAASQRSKPSPRGAAARSPHCSTVHQA
jgi:hypothetical protein